MPIAHRLAQMVKPLASGSIDKTIRLWDVGTGTQIRALKGHTKPVRSVSFSPDGKILTSGSSDKTIRLWDVGTGEHIRNTEHSKGIRWRSIVYLSARMVKPSQAGVWKARCCCGNLPHLNPNNARKMLTIYSLTRLIDCHRNLGLRTDSSQFQRIKRRIR